MINTTSIYVACDQLSTFYIDVIKDNTGGYNTIYMPICLLSEEITLQDLVDTDAISDSYNILFAGTNLLHAMQFTDYQVLRFLVKLRQRLKKIGLTSLEYYYIK